MKLNELSPAEGAHRERNRKGRGVGSGWGKTAGRGSKGQKARSGGAVRAGFEGGQMPIQRRLPKRGFKNPFRKIFAVVNIKDLAEFTSGSVVDVEALIRQGLVKGRFDGIKLLGQGDIDRPVDVKLHAVSKSARDKILAAGGKVEVI
jgi:large subunit ribosomal protein L15